MTSPPAPPASSSLRRPIQGTDAHRVTWRIAAQAQLTDDDRQRMLALMQLCYEGVVPERFFADLAAKQFVLLLVAPGEAGRSNEIVGFSTIRLTEVDVAGRRARVLFSGDTVLHPSCWGSKALQKAFTAFVVKEKLRRPFSPLYWLLLSKGYRTYLLLTHYFPVAFPRVGFVPPPALVELRDRVASLWWGDEYDPHKELLIFREQRDRVRGGVAPIDAQAALDPDVAFFVERNPGYGKGDELVCLALLDGGLPIRLLRKLLFRQRRLPRVSSTRRIGP